MRVHVDSAGKMEVPQAVRDALGVPAGGDIELNRDGRGRTYLEPVAPSAEPDARIAPSGLDRIRGSLKTDKTTDEMMEFLRGD